MYTTPDERAKNLDRHSEGVKNYMIKKANIDLDDVVPVGIPSPNEFGAVDALYARRWLVRLQKVPSL